MHVPDLAAVPEAELPSPRTRAAGVRTVLAVPLLRRGVAIGAIHLPRREVRPFTEREIALVQTFADQAVIAIENARLFQELQDRTRELARSVDELTALGEVTQAVSSTLDLDEVLARIVDHARRLSGPTRGRSSSTRSPPSCSTCARPSAWMGLRSSRCGPPRCAWARGRSGAQRSPASPSTCRTSRPTREFTGRLRVTAQRSGLRAILAVPLLREARVLGGLALYRNTPGAFPPEVVALLQTFAGQSALAIQNARLFRELEEKGRELEEVSRHKSQFLATMSHELRTPLNAIIGYSEMLQEEAQDLGDDTAAAFGGDLQKITEAGRHLLGLINDILDLAKIEAGRMDLFPEDFAVADLVQGVAAVAAPLARQRGNRLVGGLPGGPGRDARRPDQGAPGPVQPALQRGQVHRAGRDHPHRGPRAGRGRGGRRGRGRLAGVPGGGHRDRDDPGAAGAPVRGVHPGRGLDHAPVRGHGPGPGPDPPLLPDAGRRGVGGERGRHGLHLHHPPAGGRAPGGAGGPATASAPAPGPGGDDGGGRRRARCW